MDPDSGTFRGLIFLSVWNWIQLDWIQGDCWAVAEVCAPPSAIGVHEVSLIEHNIRRVVLTFHHRERAADLQPVTTSYILNCLCDWTVGFCHQAAPPSPPPAPPHYKLWIRGWRLDVVLNEAAIKWFSDLNTLPHACFEVKTPTFNGRVLSEANTCVI